MIGRDGGNGVGTKSPEKNPKTTVYGSSTSRGTPSLPGLMRGLQREVGSARDGG